MAICLELDKEKLLVAEYDLQQGQGSDSPRPYYKYYWFVQILY